MFKFKSTVTELPSTTSRKRKIAKRVGKTLLVAGTATAIAAGVKVVKEQNDAA